MLPKESPDGIVDVKGGVLVDFFKFMKAARNFTYTIVREPDGIWGNCEGKHNCTGMVGMVLRGEVDFALGNTEFKLFLEKCFENFTQDHLLRHHKGQRLWTLPSRFSWTTGDLSVPCKTGHRMSYSSQLKIYGQYS